LVLTHLNGLTFGCMFRQDLNLRSKADAFSIPPESEMPKYVTF
jgi:hypothetical protein